MLVQLLDAKEYAKVDGHVISSFLISFNMNLYLDNVWSNGWCPTTQIKRDADGNFFARISNELIPTGVYNNVVARMNNQV